MRREVCYHMEKEAEKTDVDAWKMIKENDRAWA